MNLREAKKKEDEGEEPKKKKKKVMESQIDIMKQRAKKNREALNY